MTKQDFKNLIRQHTGCTVNESGKVVEAFLDSLKADLKTKGKCRIPGMGTFRVATSPATKRVNPKTGEPVAVAEKKRVSFKASDKLKEIAADSPDYR